MSRQIDGFTHLQSTIIIKTSIFQKTKSKRTGLYLLNKILIKNYSSTLDNNF